MSNEMEKRYTWTEQKKEEPIFNNSFVLKEKDSIFFAGENSHALLPEDELKAQKQKGKGFEFMNRGKMLESGEYYYKDGAKRKKATRQVKANSSMRKVVDGLKKLDTLLDSEIELDEESRKTMREAFLTVCLACETYLNRKNPWTAEGKARKQMVKDFYDQVSWESMRFEQILDSYKGREDELEGKTWLDVLSEVRIKTYQNGEDGVKVEAGGAGTSDIYVIEKNGEKKYFKENETVPKYQYADLFQDRFEAYRNEEITGKNEEERLKNKKVHDRRVLLMQASQFAFTNYYGTLEALAADFHSMYRMEKMLEAVIKADPFKFIKKGKKYNATADERIDDSLFLANYFWSIRKNHVLSSMATSVAGIDSKETITKRNAATSRLAKALGIEELIVHSEMTDVIVDGEKKRGVLMDEAKGISIALFMEDIQKKEPDAKIQYSGNAIKQLTSLQILDIICGQIDRHHANYLADIVKIADKSYEVKKIVGIDNDLAFGRLKYKAIKGTGKAGFNRIKNIEGDDGLLLPAVDKVLAQKIIDINPEILDFQMCDLLSKDERKALIDRLKGVQSALKKQMDKEEKGDVKIKDSKFITGDEGWEKKKNELTGMVENASDKCDMIDDYSYIRTEWVAEYGTKNPAAKEKRKAKK